MRVLTDHLKNLAGFEAGEKLLKQNKGSLLITGCVDSQKWNMANGFAEGFKLRLIVTYSDARVKEICEDYRIYDKNVKAYPAKDAIFYQADVHGNKITKERLLCIKRLLMGLPCTVVTTFGGLMNAGVSLEVIKKNILKLNLDMAVSEKEISAKLCALGYEKTYQVETGGQYSIRGGIVDIFDLTEENPYRIELWGDEITSIRSFDVQSQRSIERLEGVTIYPACEVPLSEDEMLGGLRDIVADTKKAAAAFREKTMPEEAKRLETITAETREQITELPWTFNADSYISYFYSDLLSILDYMPGAIVMIDEPSRAQEHAEAVELEFRESMQARIEKGYLLPKQADILFPVRTIMNRLENGRLLLLSTMAPKGFDIKPDLKINVEARSIPSYNNNFDNLLKDLKNFRKKGYRVLLLSGSHTRAERLAKDLFDNDVLAFFSEDRNHELQEGEIMTMFGHVTKGFEYPGLRYVCITDSDIFGLPKKKKKKRYEEAGTRVRDFGDLNVGDYIVHESFGIGVYKGIEKVVVDKVSKDYMRLEYRDGGVLYVPATNLDAIMKYASSDAKKPKINKLGTQEWSHTTEKVKSAVETVAEELVQLYAIRRDRAGYVYGPDTLWQKEFEELFPYEETQDQLDAIEATKKDMESPKIMDRLVCGDVGFGKTEVAIRAAFKAVQEGKQVAFLVPTTILAQQHYDTFTERMKDFPVKIGMLSRFVTTKEQNKIIEDLKTGMVDILIGTHRILSKDIAFKDLGLLIIDEEQRFGVTHKEKIKQMREDVDVLTLTATPIPRTLHMSLVGIRDMSLLEEPPEERLPIQTYVCEYDEEMVREAINRELSRNGQVYYVFNRVNYIAEMAASIQKLVPEANVAFAHGQMKEAELERLMYDFIKGEIDVLVSTTIIETGIDIPNVNTIIIHDSDRFGLSQLYQLRGRVGRSNRTAYAFLMYKRDKLLEEVAEKRLATIREFTDLGSGYKIAMKDLEIRGAGNILGMSQHGHMAAVGYDLYCKMLNSAVQRQKGIEVKENFLTSMDLDVDAFIPGEYILNEAQKLDTYKKIASISNEEECREMRAELIDRFGKIPDACEHLLQIASLKLKARRLFITDIRGRHGEITFTFRPNADIRTENVSELLKKYVKKLSLYPKGNPVFTYNYRPIGEVVQDEKLLLEQVGFMLDEMLFYLEKQE